MKRLQLEARVGCDEVAIYVKGFGMVMQYIPRSLSYESMSQDEFKIVYQGMCRHLASTYWGGISEDKVAEMAEVMSNE